MIRIALAFALTAVIALPAGADDWPQFGRDGSRNGVSPFRRATVAPDSIGRALKVGTLVSGNVAQSGDSLRVTVSLVNAATGEEIASKTVERPRKEIFALQDDLAKEVSLFLRDRVGQEIKLRESRIGTSNM